MPNSKIINFRFAKFNEVSFITALKTNLHQATNFFILIILLFLQNK